MPIWTVELDPQVTADLDQSFRDGPLPDEQGRVLIAKRLVDRIGGLKVEIFAREHPPPHFRVTYAGETNDFTIKDCQPLAGRGLWQYHRNIRQWHQRNEARLIAVWNESRPSDCPVGDYRE